MNNLLVPIRPHPSKKISDAIKNKDGYINLTIGMPDYGPSKKILEYLNQYTVKAIDEHCAIFNKYADSRGVFELREAIALRYYKKYNFNVNPLEELILTNGAAQAIWVTIFTCTNIGDEVIIPDPCYMLYEPIILSLGRKVVRIKTQESDGFNINLRLLEKSITHKTKLLIINSPSNPTGSVYSAETLSEIANLATRKNFFVMHDEVFDDLIFKGIHVPIVRILKERKNLIMVNSFSKRYGITGWRLGWLLGSREFIEQALKAVTFMTLSVNTLIQDVLAFAVNDPDIEEELQKNKKIMSEKSEFFCKSLIDLKTFNIGAEPAGSLYVFPRVDTLYRFLPKKYQMNSISESVAKFLMNEAKIAAVPGSAFGPTGDSYLRFSIASDKNELQATILRLKNLF